MIRERSIGLRSRLKVEGNHSHMHRQPANQGYSSVWESILALATEIPALWNAPFTTFADRQIIIRQLLERIVIDIHENTENVMVALHWASGFVSQHRIVRSHRPPTALPLQAVQRPDDVLVSCQTCGR